jgi:hypothetical protein
MNRWAFIRRNMLLRYLALTIPRIRVILSPRLSREYVYVASGQRKKRETLRAVTRKRAGRLEGRLITAPRLLIRGSQVRLLPGAPEINVLQSLALRRAAGQGGSLEEEGEEGEFAGAAAKGRQHDRLIRRGIEGRARVPPARRRTPGVLDGIRRAQNAVQRVFQERGPGPKRPLSDRAEACGRSRVTDDSDPRRGGRPPRRFEGVVSAVVESGVDAPVTVSGATHAPHSRVTFVQS